jgi:D-alanine-D-alanine ligase
MGLRAKKIGVLMGGVSSEREISLRSGASVEKALSELGCNAVAIDVDRNVFEALKTIDVAFIALHGRGGEDGSIQGLLEVMGIPYTGSGVLASALAMDKAMSKTLFSATGIPTPGYIVLKHDSYSAPLTGFPVIVKPSREGSTIGVGLARNPSQYEEAVAEAYKYDSTVVVERFIEGGRELTVGILNGAPLPPIEIRPKEQIFDFRCKYSKGKTEFRIAEKNASLETLALSAYGILGCKGAARVDVMEDSTGAFYVFEVNTVPGMTETSLLPMAARAAGLSYNDLVEAMLRECLEGEKTEKSAAP